VPVGWWLWELGESCVRFFPFSSFLIPFVHFIYNGMEREKEKDERNQEDKEVNVRKGKKIRKEN